MCPCDEGSLVKYLARNAQSIKLLTSKLAVISLHVDGPLVIFFFYNALICFVVNVVIFRLPDGDHGERGGVRRAGV